MEQVKCFIPETLEEALRIRKETGATVLAGGSDLMVANSMGAGVTPAFKGDVLIIRIEPCPTPIMVDGNYYERMGTSARCVNDTYRESFLSQRRAWAAQHQPQTDLPVEEASPAPIADKQTSADSSSYD